MKITQQNIILFITYLYKQKYGQLPPSEVLNSWQNLSNEEINFHLLQMTQSWGMSESDLTNSISAFHNTIQATGNNQFANTANLNNTNSTPKTTTLLLPKKNKKGLWALLLIPIVALGGFVGYKYNSYTSLEHLYATTDNVAIRDASGKTVGRMDIFEDNNSTLSLRARNEQIFNIELDGKTSESRQLLLDDATFMDYLLGNAEKLVYVNKNFLTNNQEYNIIQKAVFKDINGNTKLMNSFKSNIRKVIIGSMANNPNLSNLAIVNSCKSSATTEYLPWIILDLKDKKTYSVIAKLSDGKYYKFKGVPDENIYEAPTVMNIKVPYENNFQPLENENLLFSKIDGYYHVFDCNKSGLGFVTKYDNTGDIQYFNWSYDIQ